MMPRLQAIYRFLPVQLFLLHFRKYQIILLFWIILFGVILNKFAKTFGAASLFLSPEYLGKSSLLSFFILGAATSIFTMAWHITTFIVHSKRLPFLGATRHSFLKYCINNSVLPFIYLIIYGIVAGRYLKVNEIFTTWPIIGVLVSFYVGHIFFLLFSFVYFFRVDRNILKTVLGAIANPSVIREIIPYDSLDREWDIVRANSYVDYRFRIRKIESGQGFNVRFVSAVLRRHHRNAVFAVLTALVCLLVLGIFIDNPYLRIPAGASFLLLFGIMMAAVGAFKHFLRSWEMIGYILLVLVIGWCMRYGIINMSGSAYGLNEDAPKPVFNDSSLRQLVTDKQVIKDREEEEGRLAAHLQKIKKDSSAQKTLIVLGVSGGGSRAAYWTFRCLQYADSITAGKVFNHTVLLNGASGGMLGAAYWRAIHTQPYLGKPTANIYDSLYQENIGKDLLNAVVFSLACIDFISPFNKITVNQNRYNKDRGYAFDQQLAQNTDGLLDMRLGDYKHLEHKSLTPQMITTASMVQDGRKMLFSSLPISYLCKPNNQPNPNNAIVDAVPYNALFKGNDPLQVELTSVLRMSATFPIILPVVHLPSEPAIRLMDAGLRDNFGIEVASRYFSQLAEYIDAHYDNVVLLQIRDTKEYQPAHSKYRASLGRSLLAPIFAIQERWSAFQSYHQTYVTDLLPSLFTKAKFNYITLHYTAIDMDNVVPLNFHLTTKEKIELSESIFEQENQNAFLKLKSLLERKP